MKAYNTLANGTKFMSQNTSVADCRPVMAAPLSLCEPIGVTSLGVTSVTSPTGSGPGMTVPHSRGPWIFSYTTFLCVQPLKPVLQVCHLWPGLDIMICRERILPA